jgi:molybdopterin-containing oxidoreductase family iron-sulfur binding subunit
MVIDLSRCIGCTACAVACKIHNNVPRNIFWSRVLFEETGAFPNYRIEATPVLCMHCDNPACVRACPTGASFKREDGIVCIDRDRCIGCRSCMVSCPYGARQFMAGGVETYYPGQRTTIPEARQKAEFLTGVVSKCEFCASRLQEGLKPACVGTCPTRARHFGDLDDPEDPIHRLIFQGRGRGMHEEAGTRPSVYYLPR